MNVCIFGAGAIGGHLAARLIAQGEADVSMIARGAHLAALRARGVTMRSAGREIGGRPLAATHDPATLPAQDLVIVTLKAPALPAQAAPIARLLGSRGVALFAMNGAPWWWNYKTTREGPLTRLDPDGALWREIGPHRALHCVINSSNDLVEPGVIAHAGSNRWRIGEPGGAVTPRVEAVVALFRRAGLGAEASGDIRADVWRKLCLNICSNPLVALTRLTSRQASQVEGLADVAAKLVEEALGVAAALGYDLRHEIDPNAIARAAGGGEGRSSMLQDVEAERPLEVEAILGQVQAFARETGAPTPTIDCVLPLLRGLDLSLRLQRAGRRG